MIHCFSDIAEKAPFKTSARKWEIINALVFLLEKNPHHPVTTAKLAAQTGISEAALYRHFSSKDNLFLVMTDLTEQLIFHRLEKNLKKQHTALVRLHKTVDTLVHTLEEYPGLSLIFSGLALTGSCEQLLIRHERLCERIESGIRKLLVDAVNIDNIQLNMSKTASASLIMSWLEGKIWRFVRSGFSMDLSRHLIDDWKILLKGMTD